MISITHKSSRTGEKFHSINFDVTGVPLVNANSIFINEALNDENSIYKDGSFDALANGSSYGISVRGSSSQDIFLDVESIKSYILSKLNSSVGNFVERKRKLKIK